MNNLNFDMLLTTTEDDIISDVNQVFSNLLNEIHKYIGLGAINFSVEIIISDELDEPTDNFLTTLIPLFYWISFR